MVFYNTPAHNVLNASLWRGTRAIRTPTMQRIVIRWRHKSFILNEIVGPKRRCALNSFINFASTVEQKRSSNVPGYSNQTRHNSVGTNIRVALNRIRWQWNGSSEWSALIGIRLILGRRKIVNNIPTYAAICSRAAGSFEYLIGRGKSLPESTQRTLAARRWICGVSSAITSPGRKKCGHLLLNASIPFAESPMNSGQVPLFWRDPRPCSGSNRRCLINYAVSVDMISISRHFSVHRDR